MRSTAKSIMRKARKNAGIQKRKAEREEITNADDEQLKNDIADMRYILYLRTQLRSLNAIEKEACECLLSATTKRKRYYAIKRFKEVIYN